LAEGKFGLRRFHVRGLKKVASETLWAVLTYKSSNGYVCVGDQEWKLAAFNAEPSGYTSTRDPLLKSQTD
jgi:hypothetical protein